ncbi:hypothetical protein BDQ12DRAFT_727346 [Crucibulum laeve]|uniref:Uncharacterized protein n=1 Tax=Crucibulum laeve TaxID=68775 RepID=A0A5C3LPK6_9AGAR|nr:hypothetical protein BDQ12DRAFT_727346 [Crucibulum laeve]
MSTPDIDQTVSEIHQKLVEAAEADTLSVEYIQQNLKFDNCQCVTRGPTAYINWSTTVALELPGMPADFWFAGVARPGTDYTRDTTSQGIKYFWNINLMDVREDEVFAFYIQQRKDRVYITIVRPPKSGVYYPTEAAFFEGTQSVICGGQLVAADYRFAGKGLWGSTAAFRGSRRD